MRSEGKTYKEIQNQIGVAIPKSTLSLWCKKIDDFSDKKSYENKIRSAVLGGGSRGRQAALVANKIRRKHYLQALEKKNAPLVQLLQDSKIGKITLAVLYLAEGGKFRKGAVMFGNSDPAIIALFLNLLRKTYPINRVNFRCTVQCRSDQSISALESFWEEVTRIPRSQFYRARVDMRSVGKITRKSEYKGVYRIDYFSANIYNDIMSVCKLIQEHYGPVAQG